MQVTSAIQASTVSSSNDARASDNTTTPTLKAPSIIKFSKDSSRPRLHRAATMPSGWDQESTFAYQGLDGFPVSDGGLTTSTAPTSPSSAAGSFAFSYRHGSADSDAARSPSSVDSYGACSSPGQTKKGKKDDAFKIARPPNAWILYRSQKLADFKDNNPKMYIKKTRSKADRGSRPTQASFSKQIAEMWAAEAPSVKEYYHHEAALRSMVHANENPGYRFNPNKCRKERVKKEGSPSKSPKRLASQPLKVVVQPPAQSVLPSVLRTPPPTAHSGLNMQGATWPQLGQTALFSPNDAYSFQSVQQPSQLHPVPTFAGTHERRPSLQAQWSAIFPEDEPASASTIGSFSSFSSSVNSPLWPTDLLPALSIGESSGFPAFSQPSSPFADTLLSSSYQSTGPTTPQFSTYQFQPSPGSFSTASMDDQPQFWFSSPSSCQPNQLLAPPTTMARETDSATIAPSATLPDWWPYRHMKFKPDDEGVPLEELLQNLNAQRGQL